MKTEKRATKLKKQILSLLEENHLLTAPQIVEMLHSQGSKVNKTSVYRNLESFLSDGLICQQSFGETGFSYELQNEHHDHIRCDVCGKVTEIPCQFSPEKQLEGYTIGHHHLTLFGVCRECQT
jgi:Fur family ferric uptake transcriptional regulator